MQGGPPMCAATSQGPARVSTSTREASRSTRRRLADGPHTVRMEAVDAAGNVGAVERRIQVDNTPPARPAGLTLEGGKGWRSANDFAVTWLPVTDSFAPVVAAHYSICALQGARACTEGSASGENIHRLAGLAVPGPGEYELRVWLEDGAGNRDAERNAGPLRLRFDDTAPALAFEPQDERDPTRVSVVAARSRFRAGWRHGRDTQGR